MKFLVDTNLRLGVSTLVEMVCISSLCASSDMVKAFPTALAQILLCHMTVITMTPSVAACCVGAYSVFFQLLSQVLASTVSLVL